MTTTREGLRFHSHFGDDRERRAKVDDIIEATFDLDLQSLTTFDFHDPDFTPFSWFDETGTCVANAAVYPMPMMLAGSHVHALAIQSVATRPEWRMQGLFRDLIARALDWCDARTELVILKTDTPSLYHRFGFETRTQSRFRVKTAGITLERPDGTKDLDIRCDAELVKRLFRNRAAVSNEFALLDHGTMFFLEAVLDPGFGLHYLPPFDAIVVTCETAAGTLQIDNVIGRTIPPLSVLLGTLDHVPDVLEFGFHPDRLAIEAEVTPLKQVAQIMTRGKFLSKGQPFRVPASGI